MSLDLQELLANVSKPNIVTPRLKELTDQMIRKPTLAQLLLKYYLMIA